MTLWQVESDKGSGHHDGMMRYPVTYLRLLARAMRLDDDGLARLVEGTALRVEDLTRLDGEVSEADYQRIVARALSMDPRPDLALAVASRLPVTAHGPLGVLLSASPTLGDAWAALERFHSLRVPGVQLQRAFTRDALILTLTVADPESPVGRFCLEATALCILGGFDLVLGYRLREAQIRFGYAAPAHADRYATYFSSPVSFASGPTCIQVPLRLLQQPNLLADPGAWEAAVQACEALTAQRDSSSRWSERITRLLQQNPGQRWQLAALAEHWGMSSRTLMRYLKSEGTSYQDLLDQVLSQQARVLLERADHTVESVALSLGYQDATAFRRAHKRWFGTAPRQGSSPGE